MSLAPPNNTIPIKLSGTALGKSSGVFTLGGSPHSMSYDSQTKLLELDLDQPNINAVNPATEAALGTDWTHYTGWDTFQSTYALALRTHNRCVVWTPSAAVPKRSVHATGRA